MTNPPTKNDSLSRCRRWCVFGWVVACLMTVTAVAGTAILASALRTEAALTREAQTMAAKHLLELAATRLKLRDAEQRACPPWRISNPSAAADIEQGVPAR